LFIAYLPGDFTGDFYLGDSWIVPRRLIAPDYLIEEEARSFLPGD